MTPFTRGLILTGLHLALVGSLGAKLLYDRATRPRTWIKVAPVDPDLPIRGRYLSLSLQVPAEGFSIRQEISQYPKGKAEIYEYLDPTRGDLVVRDGKLVAEANPAGKYWVSRLGQNGDASQVVVSGNTAYFLPEHARDPSFLKPGEELWVEATIPRSGPPRPIQLGVKKEGVLTPLEVR